MGPEWALSYPGLACVLFSEDRLSCHRCELENDFDCENAVNCNSDERYCVTAAISKYGAARAVLSAAGGTHGQWPLALEAQAGPGG